MKQKTPESAKNPVSWGATILHKGGVDEGGFDFLPLIMFAVFMFGFAVGHFIK
jgi:hypothetical protein